MLPTRHTDQQLAAHGLYRFSDVMGRLLYGPDSYYSGGHVKFMTDDDPDGDYYTYATKGIQLAIITATKIFDIFKADYYNNPAEDFICYELSGGLGLFVHKILSIIQDMANNASEEREVWQELWKRIKIRTYETSQPLSDKQNALMEKFNEDCGSTPRYISIRKDAEEIDTSNKTALVFSNELFDALPHDLLLRNNDDEVCVGYCIPIVERSKYTGEVIDWKMPEGVTFSMAGDKPFRRRAVKFGLRFMAQPEFTTYGGASLEEITGTKWKETARDYVIPKLDPDKPIPHDVKFVPFFVPISKLEISRSNDDIRYYADLIRLKPGHYSYFSQGYEALLKHRLRHPNIRHNLHFDYFSYTSPENTTVLGHSLRQYPADPKYGHDFTLHTKKVDITYNPDLWYAAHMASEAGLITHTDPQAAPYFYDNARILAVVQTLVSIGKLDEGQFFEDLIEFLKSNFYMFETSTPTYVTERDTVQAHLKPRLDHDEFREQPFMTSKAYYDSPLGYMLPYDYQDFLENTPFGRYCNAQASVWIMPSYDTIEEASNDNVIKLLKKYPFLLHKKITISGVEQRIQDHFLQSEGMKEEVLLDLFSERHILTATDFFLENGKPIECPHPSIKAKIEFQLIYSEWILRDLININGNMGTSTDRKPLESIRFLLKIYKNIDFSALQTYDTSKYPWAVDYSDGKTIRQALEENGIKLADVMPSAAAPKAAATGLPGLYSHPS